MKLSFALPSKQASRPNIRASQNFDEDDSGKNNEKSSVHEYVTVFDSSKTPADNSHKKLIIPPKQNEWRPEKKMKNLEIPFRSATVDSELSFEREAPSLAGDASDSGMTYGLNLRQNIIRDGGIDNEKKSSDAADDDAYVSQQSAPGLEGVLLQKLKDHLRTLPEDRGFEEFDDVPVEGFGAALLAGYGWSEGRGIGRNAKADVKVFQINKRTAKEGLGFIADMPESKSKGQNSAVLDDQKATARNLRNFKGLSAGNDVRIVAGRNAGAKGKIMDILGADSASPSVVLKLLRSEERVTLHFSEIAELGSVEEEKCLKKLKELDIDDRRNRVEQRDSSNGHRHRDRRDVDGRRKDNKRSRDEGRRGHKMEYQNVASNPSSNQGKEKKASAAAPISWLASNIRVRIISKDLKGGRLYLKKGEIVDVVGPTTCDITMDDSRELIQGVDQDLLETALPRRGGQVIVLYGKHKGVLGSLVSKDLDEETGVVQDADSHEFLNIRLEQIAEYVGDPSYLDY